MINIISNTSITSINGVMFISTITSGSPELFPEPIFIAMKGLLYQFCSNPKCVSTGTRRWFCHEADFCDTGTLCGKNYFADKFIAGVLVATDIHCRLWCLNSY